MPDEKEAVMALSTGPIPRVAVGDIIEEDWGDSVAQSLNNLTELSDYVVWAPATGVSYDADVAGLMTNWFTFGGATPIQITVPDWATSAYAHFQVGGVRYNPTTAGRTSYLIQAKIGSLLGRQIRFSGQGGWFGASWSSAFPDIEDIAGGDRSVSVRAQRIEGTGTDRWRLDDQSDVSMWIMFGRAVNWYPGL